MTQQWIDFRLLKERLSFEDVLQHYKIELKRKNGSGGHQLHGFCPLPGHNGQKKSPSFSVNMERKCFQCFGCHAKGNHLDLAVLMEGKSPANRTEVRAVAVMLVEAFGIECGKPAENNGGGDERKPAPPPRSAPTRPQSKPVTKPEAHENAGQAGTRPATIINAPLDFELRGIDPHHPYLKERGFSAETIMHFGLGFCNRGLMAGRVVIPLRDQQAKLIGYAGRFTRDDQIGPNVPKYLFPSNRERKGEVLEFKKSRFLYNGHAIKEPVRDLVVVEGFPSVWWLWQCGFANVVALMGSSCSPDQATLILNAVSVSGRVWLMPDAGDAGERCAESLLPQVASHRFTKWVTLDDGRQPTDLSADELVQRLEWKVVP
jgi:DNA primase